MGDAPGPGWWLASDGRYYPPESTPGPAVDGSAGRAPVLQASVPLPPVPLVPAPVAPAPAPAARRPFYRRLWFWLVIGFAVVMVVVVGAVVWFIASLFAPTDDAADTTSLTTVESIDSTTAPEGLVASTDAWSASVSGGVLMLRANRPGAVYPYWTHVDPTDHMKVAGNMHWADGAATAGEVSVGGVMILSPQGQGYGLGCGTDGSMYFVSIGIEQTVVLEATPNAGCRDEFSVQLDVTAGSVTDIIGLVLPDGTSSAWAPGTALGTFTDAGFMMLTFDPDSTVPGLDVSHYDVLVAE